MAMIPPAPGPGNCPHRLNGTDQPTSLSSRSPGRVRSWWTGRAASHTGRCSRVRVGYLFICSDLQALPELIELLVKARVMLAADKVPNVADRPGKALNVAGRWHRWWSSTRMKNFIYHIAAF